MPPVTWTVGPGSLPAGLNIDASGVITGTATTPETASFTVVVTDFVGAMDSKNLSITIAAAPSVTTASLPGGTVGIGYSQTVTATGGTAPLVWSLSAGSLPAGINPITSGGAIIGTPTTPGISNFTVLVTDAVGATASKALSITIAAAPSITTASLPGGTVGTAYSQTLAATGGTAPLTWSLSAGSLPTGINPLTSGGAIAGTPSAAGTANFTVLVTDAVGATASKALSIDVAAGLTITTSSLPGGTVGHAYSQTVTSSGGTAPLTFSLSAGSLPAGINPITSGGAIAGTPSAAGTSNFTVLVTDAVGATATKALSIVVAAGLSVTTASLPGGTEGAAYSQTVTASGGTAPLTWSLSTGTLPAGINPITSGGAIAGTPSAAGTSNFTVLVTDAVGATASKALSIVVAAGLSVTTSTLPGGTVGHAYSQTVTASGGTAPLTWSLSAGSLPAGVNPITSGGAIAGTPTAAGTANFTVLVTDAVGATATQALSIVVAAGLSVTTSSLPGGTVGVAFSQTVTATGGTAPLTWSLSAGSLPAGINPITNGGAIAGTPSAAGTSNFTVLVTDAVGATATKALSIVVAAGLSVTTATLPGGTVGAAYSLTVTASGGTAPLTWSLSAGSLPTGINPITSGGAIAGTPSAAETANFTVLVTDAVGATATKALSIVVAAGLSVTTSSLPGGTVGHAYSQTVTASGGTAPLTWSLSAGSLPTGINPITSAGLIAGTPSAAGTFNFTVLVTDSVGATATKALSIVVAAGLSITTSSLPGGTIGVAYSQTVAASGGTAPLTFSLSAGSLPAGINPITSGGGIAGTPTTAGTSNFTVLVTDAVGATATKPLSIVVAAGLSITTSSLPGGTAGAAYSQTMAATGGTAPLTWSLSAGSLPTGINPITSGGAIVGTPTTAGTFNFTVLVTDNVGATATKALSIVVAAGLSISTSSLPGGTIGAAYSQTVTATGGTAPLTFSLSAGSLPAGINPITSGGAIAGTPSAAGTANFTVLVTDAVGATATKALSIVVAAGLSVTTSSLPGGTVGAAYSQTVTASGGTAPLTWSLSAGSLPAGINPITSGGAIAGTPSAAGTSNFTVLVTDAVGATATKALSIVVAAGLSVTTTTLPGDTVGVAYSQTVTASGGTAPLSWSLSAGSLPTGINPITSGGIIAGTPSAAGTFNFTVLVTDAVGATATKALSIVVAAGLSVTTASLPGGTVGAAYSQTVTASGGTAPLTWSLSAGSLPAGINPITSGGVIAGTPSAAGTSNFTVRVTDAVGATVTKALSIVVAAGLSISTPSLPGGTMGAAYAQTMAATGGTAPLTWSLSAGSLPAGINPITSGGAIAGSPTTAGTSNFTVLVTDAAGATATKALSIVIAVVPAITTTSLPGGTVGAAYSQTPVVTGGTAPLTWSLVASTLPAGLALNSSSGAITGTPTAPGIGTTAFTLQVTDAAGATSLPQALSITIAPAITITTASLPGGTIGAAYSQTVAATGGTAPLTWTLSVGSLPAGFSPITSGGAIAGTPTTAGTTNFTVKVTDAAGATATKALSIVVAAAMSITTASLPGGTVGAVYSQTPAATGGTAPRTWTVSPGTLPAGLSINASTGAITGTPSTAGIANFTLVVTDAANATATKALSITIAALLSITTTSLPGGTIGAPYSQTLVAAGGTAPLTWSLSAGTLPAGFLIGASTGLISGTPTTNATANFTVHVVDSAGATDSQAMSITIAATLTITTTSLPGATVGAIYSQTARSAGGTSPVTWTVSAGALPAGLTIDASSGVIAGTPTTAGTASFTLQATDAATAVATLPLTIVVAVPPSITTTGFPDGTTGTPYSTTVIGAGGTAPYVWLITTGSLPTGLSLAAGTGVISGTPLLAGTSNFTVQVLDGAGATVSAPLAITVTIPLSITTAVMQGGTLGAAYSQILAASGGASPYTAWTVTVGTLPPGLLLDANTGTVAGTPTATGTSAFTIRVNDSGNPSRTASKALSIVVAFPLAITTTTLPNGHTGAAYSATLAGSGGTTPYTWTVSSGFFLPAGLTLNASTGAISGTPTTLGTSNFLIQASDSGNPVRTVSQPLSITIVPALAIATTSLQGGNVGSSYSQTVTATGDTPPFTWAVTSGTLPAGLTLIVGTGEIRGTPTTVGLSNFTLQVTDSTLPVHTTASRALSINIDPGGGGGNPLTITSSTLSPGTIGVQYAQSVGVTGGILPYNLVVVGTGVPTGLTLSAAGVLTGTPTDAGTFSFTVKVTDSATPAQSATKSISITIVPALTITTTSLPAVVVGTAYSTTMAASGGTLPYTWSLTAGALPGGITLSGSTGVISGTPNASGTFNFRINVADSLGLTSFKNFSIDVSFPQIDLTIAATSKPTEQPQVGLTLRSPYPSNLSGQLTLTFAPNAAVPNDDLMLQFSNGTRTANFTIAANSTTAVFSPPVQLLVGTVAGTVTMTANFTGGPSNQPAGTTVIATDAPQILAVDATQTSGVIVVRVTGYSVTRSVTNAIFAFDVKTASGTQRVTGSRSVDTDFGGWYLNSQSAAYGSEFVFSQSINVQGDATAFTAVVVTLSNAQGSVASDSAPVVRK